MGDTLENLASAGGADVSAAVSVTGLPAAEVLKRKFGGPYVTGLPVGKKASEKFIRELRAAGGMARSGASSDTAASSGTGLTKFPHPADAAGCFSAAGAAEKENAFDAEGHPAALVAAAEQEGGRLDGQIAQKQFRELPMLSGLPTTREAPAQPLSLQHHVDGLDMGRARG